MRLASQPQIIAYTVTDVDKLSSTAFILVPGLDGQAPASRSTAPLEVVSGQQLTINLRDLVVRPGKSPRITQDSKVQAGRFQWGAAGEGRDHHRVHIRRRLRGPGGSLPRGHRRCER